MKKMVLIVDDKFAKCKAVDFDEIKFFKDYPMNLVMEAMLEMTTLEMEKNVLNKKFDNLSTDEKADFLKRYTQNKALLCMYTLSQAVSKVYFKDYKGGDDCGN